MNCKNPADIIIEAGQLLQERGLVVRTWGNVSVRTDASHFSITPTGARYETLQETDIVQVSLETMQATGHRLPSSEILVHAKIYRCFPHVSFILHTHQNWASLLSLFCYGKMSHIPINGDWVHLLGSALSVAEYAEAGTEKIAQNLIDAILDSSKKYKYSSFNECTNESSKCIESGLALMANHGVVVFAQNQHHAFKLAESLEDYARFFILNKLQVLNTDANAVFDAKLFDDVAFLDSLIEKIEDGMFFVSSKKSHLLSYLFACLLSCKNSKKVVNNAQRGIAKSCPKRIGAYFDDVAQIGGAFFGIVNMKDAQYASINKKGKTLNDSRIFIVEGEGLLLLAPSKEEVCYMIRLFEKNIVAFLLSLIDEKIEPLSFNIKKKQQAGYITNY